jgi:hypothetical protein
MAKKRRAGPALPPRVRAKAPRAIVIHSLAQARAALTAAASAGAALELWSAEGAAASAGAGWFKAVVEAARQAVPGVPSLAVLDCADMPGYALGAFRIGLEAVCFSGSAKVAAKLAEIARLQGSRLLRRRRHRALDLAGASDPYAACSTWLAGEQCCPSPTRARR